ncbi:2,3-diaminopropionate biosynthesis protein SbnB [Xenorhabdus bovienii]|uniref:2,3-diaminopropionate biosynthesis protein SbnB n=1 Tax=Xenorhabdus bovienii TaxID=40576 RepID=UPI003DA62BCF
MTDNKFTIISGNDVEVWIKENKEKIIEIIKKTYCLFSDGMVTNPDSYFLRFPDSDKNRIIALPASIEHGNKIAGIKWVSSFPDNIQHGLNRASAVVILNDRNTGYPIACIEGSQISSARTATSAIIGAEYLHQEKRCDQLAVIGTGLISFSIVEYLYSTGWKIENIVVSDLSETNAAKFISYCKQKLGIEAKYLDTTDAISQSDLIIFATSAVSPHIVDPALFSHNPTVLHISLRDLSTDIILKAENYVDDISHAVKAHTSLHLTAEETRDTKFIKGSISDLIQGKVKPDKTKLRIYSPFGMGMLDIAVAENIYSDLKDISGITISDFHPLPVMR